MSFVSPLRVLAVPALPIASTLTLAALGCGSGPTEGPKPPDSILVALQGDGGGAGTVSPLLMPLTTTNGGAAGAGRAPKDPPKATEPGELTAASSSGGDSGPDPMNGAFSMAQATEGLAGEGAVVALIKTSKGDLRCRLDPDHAPMATANFVGLARGTRPFKDHDAWVKRPAYDGTTFHRVIKGFMIQGGDPQGTGRGEPGYVFKDEMWPGGKHDRAGLLCMANRGPDTNGMQFFITDAAAAHLDRSYTIFGECSPASVVHAIANVAVDGSDRPLAPVTIDKVEITRASANAMKPPPR